MSYERAFKATGGIVASAHRLASACGVAILKSGGNVVDSAIATSAALCVVQNNSCGLGGDMFAIVKVDGKVLEINGSGRAAEEATIDHYEGLGHHFIPSIGPLSCITVPGLVHSWGELLKYATMDIDELLRPAILLAEEGFELDTKYVDSIRASLGALGQFDNWRSLFLVEGETPSVGFKLKQKDLADSLTAISKEGTQTFYDGDLAERIVTGARQQGALVSERDFRRHHSDWVVPLSTRYHNVKIYETSPNSQAATVLLWMNMLEFRDLNGLNENPTEMHKLLVDTCLKAYRERAIHITDPSFFPLSPTFTSKKYAEDVLESPWTLDEKNSTPSDRGDTTYFAVGDSEGNCVSMIQSNYSGFGSGIVPNGTGVVLHNRGSYFTLNKEHHNSLAPGKRTFHTLCACFGEKDEESLFALGSMGGDIQPQVHVQLLTKMLDFGLDIQKVVSAPRWFIPATIYEPLKTIFYENNAPSSNLPKSLEERHLDGLSSHAGHAQIISFEPSALFGAADPRCSGFVDGF